MRGAVAVGALALAGVALAGSYRQRTPAEAPPYVTPPNANVALRSAATGFFRLERASSGRWWFIDPKGVGVFPTGVQSVTFNGCRCERDGKTTYAYRETNMRMFDSFEAWAADTCAKLRAWGFNMLGHGSSLSNRGFIEAPTLALGYGFWKDAPEDPDRRIGETWPLVFPNVFHPDFERHCRAAATKICGARKDDPWLLGWFIDNEVSWRGTAKGKVREDYATGLFDTVRALPSTHTARQALEAFLAESGASATGEVARATKVAFLTFAAERYFRITSEAIRAADPNHLVLGCRFIQLMELEVWPVCAKWCDAISANLYPWADLDRGTLHATRKETETTLGERLEACGRLTGGKPILVTEWSYLAFDSGLPCTQGSGQRFYTQAERAAAAVLFARTMARHPLVVGWAFFRWVDQPKAGISATFAENGNYGLVNEAGQAYALAEALGVVQREIAKERMASALPVPASGVASREALRARHVAAARAELMARADRARTVSVRQEGKRIAVENGAGLALELGVGEGTALRNIRLDGRSMGQVISSRQVTGADGKAVWKARWRADRVSYVRESDGAVRLLVDDLAFTVFPGLAEVLCDGPDGVRFEMRFGEEMARHATKPPHWNIWRPESAVSWTAADGRRVTLRYRAPDVTVAIFGK